MTKNPSAFSLQPSAFGVTPASLGFRMPAEWEPHAATWLAWPHNLDTWPGKFTPIPGLYVEMVQTLHRYEPVNICVNDAEAAAQVRHLLTQAGVDRGRVTLYEIRTNDTWARDHGPIFLTRVNDGHIELAVTDWIFNSWGEKYGPWDLDDEVPRKIAAQFGLPLFEPGVVLEGGSIDVNGRGTLLTTEACLLNPNRNPSLTRTVIEDYLRAYLGVSKILWLGDGIVGDDTDGHVDDLARFVDPTTVVCMVEDDPADVNYVLLRDNFMRLQHLTDQDDRPLRVVPLSMPSPVEYVGRRLPASYANFYIANGVVLVPTYACANDQRALATLQGLFPSRQVIGVPCTDLVWGLGAIHCVTQQQPAADCGLRIGKGAIATNMKGYRRIVLLVLSLLSSTICQSLLFLLPALAQDVSRRSAVVVAAEKASPAVVSIVAAQEVERRANPFGGDPLFDDFFRDFFQPFQQRQTEQSLGSGVVIRADGYVLTNEHVVVQAGKIQVQLADDKKLNARLVGADSDSDLAVLKVDDPKSLPYLPLGSSDDLMIGETVIAIGNPFGLSHTVTTGVVSALNRSLNTDGRMYYDFIQTDASINPGNSGGPLLNIKGELIGINTAIYGKAQGIGFAIPISRAKRIVQELISHGAVEPPWIGLVVQTVTPELASHFSLKEKQGVLVRGVELGSPAANAGLQRGDVLLECNGRPLHSAEEYWQREREYNSGDTLRLRVRRGSGEEDVAVTASRFPQEKADDLAWQLLGLAVTESEDGLEVKKVRPGSPAARIGVERGDAILGLSGTQTKTVAEFRRKIIDARLSQSLLVSLGRGRQLYHVTIPLEQG